MDTQKVGMYMDWLILHLEPEGGEPDSGLRAS